MDSKLLDAILSMDAYNRGYDQGIKINTLASAGQSIGDAIIIQESDIASGSTGVNLNFYGIAYDYHGGTIISYRGTDDPSGLSGDIVNGWVIGAGQTTNNQATLAFDFYSTVGASLDPGATISLTGHSLGGGLAGLVGANDYESEKVAA